MKNIRIAIFSAFLVGVLIIFSVPVNAEEDDGELYMPNEYSDFLDSLPEDVIDELPESFLSDNPEEVGDGIRELTSPKQLISMLFSGLSGSMRSIMPTFTVVIGIMLFSSLTKELFVNFKPGISSSFVSKLCIISAVLFLVYDSIDLVSKYFSGLCKMSAAYLPLAAVLYAMGGNVTTAVASTSTFGVCLSVCQFIFTYTAIPIFVFCMSLAVVSSFYESKIISSISGAIKKYYTMILSFVMTVLGIAISSQTFISSKADSASMRGAKFVVGNFVPVSGGTISASLGAIASGVELIRGCVGIGGIVIIFMMFFPLVCHLLVMKFLLFGMEMLSFATGEENSVIAQLSSLYSYLLGIAAISSVVFILSFGLLAFCASAI